jgi:hypothetical protein
LGVRFAERLLPELIRLAGRSSGPAPTAEGRLAYAPLYECPRLPKFEFIAPLPLLAALLAALLASCSGGGGGSASAAPPAQNDPEPGPTVMVDGTVTFDLVPAVAGTGLDYAHITPSPARGVTVEAVNAATSAVLASSVTDAAGHYSLSVAANTEVLIRARAELERTEAPAWDVRVVDNTSNDALYVLDSPQFSTGSDDQTRDLHAASGWDGAAYSSERAAAPFAILDVVYEAMQFVQGAVPITEFPPLDMHWSTKNSPTETDSGGPNPATGELGTSFFNTFGIYLLGAEDSDTDEYDRHVIAHEWGHYFENSFSRSDSIGGPHSRGDQLDLRTAFSEGFGNAMSGILTGDSVYADTLGVGQTHGFAFDVERPLTGGATTNPGWFSEESIQQLIYDLYDSTPDKPEDQLALGFAPIYDSLADHVRTSVALTSIFPFIEGLKLALPEDQAVLIDPLIGTEAIDEIGDDYGTGQTNGGYLNSGVPAPPDSGVLPIYREAAVGEPVDNVCSTDDFEGATGSVNKLGSRAFLRFNVPVPGTFKIAATTTSMPSGATADPDMLLHQHGVIAPSEQPPNETTCTASNPAGCNESFSRLLAPGDYVLEVYEWTNTQDHDSDFPPIGTTCFKVEITQL